MAEISNVESSQQLPSIEQPIEKPIELAGDIGEKLKSYQEDRQRHNDKVNNKPSKQPYFDNSRSQALLNKAFNYEPPTDPGSIIRPFSYSAGYETGNFERYYTHPLYKKVGYSPFRDNEKLYNDASTGWQDFKRMSHQWGGLAGLGALDMYQEIFSMNSLKEDITNADRMQKAMAIGSSTRPGFGSSLTNFAMNVAYTAGIVGEMGVEELLLAGATTASGGTDSPVTVPLMGTRLARGISKIKDLVTTTRSFNDAKKLFETSNLARTAGKVGKEALDFLNPLEHTTKLLSGETKIGRAGKAFSEVDDFIKAKKTAGALWGDITGMRAVLSESKLEGGGVYRDTKKKLIDEFYKKNGRGPDTQEEANDIENRAHGAARSDVLGNIPMIYGSNKIVLETALGGISSLDKLITSGKAITGKIIEKPGAKLGQDLYERVGTYSMKGITNAIKPTNLAKNGLKYTLANFTEGAQELGQDILANANVDYYTNPNNDPSIIGNKAYLASLAKGVETQLSGQGFETFASGFFMGSVLQGPQKLIFNGIPRAIDKVVSPVKYAAYQKAKEDFTNDLVNAMNETSKSLLMTIKALDRNFLSLKNGRAILEKAIENKDEKIKHDSKEEMMFNHIYTLLEGGKEHILKTQLKQLKEMDDNSLAEALNLDHLSEGERKDIRTRLDGFENKINLVKDKFDYYDKNFTNPFQENSIPYQSLEFAKKTAVFARHDFDNTLERLHKITDTYATNKPLTKASYSDFALLFESEKMNHELETLKSELDIYKEGTDPEAKKKYKEKSEKFEKLKNLKEAIVKYGTDISESPVTKDDLKTETKPTKEQSKSTDKLYKAYSEYVHHLAKETGEHALNVDIANSFVGIKDYYAIKEDNAQAAKAINILADPEFLKGYVERSITLAQIREEREIQDRRNALAEFIRSKENNDLLNALYEIGVFVNVKDSEALIEKGIIPVNVYDMVTLELIPAGSEKDIKVQALLADFKIITTPAPEEVTDKTSIPIVPETPSHKITILTPWEDVPQEVKLSFIPEFKKWDASKDETDRILTGKETDQQLLSLPILKTLWLQKTEVRESILKVYNEKTHRTQIGPIITTKGVPVIIPGGAIYYVSPGTGKTDLAQGSAIYVDGDKVLYDTMISKGLKPSSPQEAGLELSREPDHIINLVITDTKNKFNDLKNKGKVVLTSNKFAYDIADKVYLSKDYKRMADAFQKRDSNLSREKAEEQAKKKIQSETDAFKSHAIIEIPQGKFIEDLIIKDFPKLEPEDLTEVKINDAFKTWNLGELEGQVENKAMLDLIDSYVRNDETPEGGEKFSEFRDRVLTEFLKQSEESLDGTLIVTHSMVLKLITAWEDSGRPEDFSKLDVEKFIEDNVKAGEFKEFKFGNKSIWVVRHGDTTQNKNTPGETLVRTPNAPLAQEGIKEAHENGKKLAKENITNIISSPYPRAYDSALIIEEEINKEQLPEPIIEEFPMENFQDRFDKINTSEELDDLVTDIVEEINDKYILLNTVYTQDALEEMINSKKRELAMKVSEDNISKGDHLVMKDKLLYGETGHVIVVGKGPKAIQIRVFSEPHGTTRFIKFEDLVNEVEFKVSKDIQDTDIVPKITPEGELLAKENFKLQADEAKNFQDQKAELDKLKQSKKSEDQADNDLTKDANCPT